MKKRSGEWVWVSGVAFLGAFTVGACSEPRNFTDKSNGGSAGAASGSGGASGAQGGAGRTSTLQGGVAGGSTTAQGGSDAGASGSPESGGALATGGAITASSGGSSTTAAAGGGAGQVMGGANGTQTLGGRSAVGGSAGAVGVAGAGGTSGSAGASGSVGAGGSAGVSIQQFCDLLQPRARSWLRECRVGFGDASGWWGTENIDSFCTSGRAAVEAGRLSSDPVRAEACATLSVGDCNTISAFAFGTGSRPFASEGCNGVVSPTVPLGGACHANSTHYSSECKAGFCGGKTCPGVCTSYPKLGESCDGSTPCDSAVGVCNSGKCEAYAKVGESCASGQTCSSNLVCAVDAVSPVCVEKRTTGQTCQSQYQCGVQGECYQNKCVETLPSNATCTTGTHCPVGTYCSGTCKALPQVGADCLDSGGSCVSGAYCSDETKCKLFGQQGEACPCADGLWCDETNTCRARGKLGADCSQSSLSSLLVRCELPSVCRPTTLGQGGPSNFTCQFPVGQGELCSSVYNCKSPFFCEPTSSRCQAPGANDQACNAGLPLESCQAGFFCQCTGANCTPGQSGPGVCQTRAANAAVCTSNAGCKSGICTNQKCVASTTCP